MAGTARVAQARRPEVRLPPLEPYDGGKLEPDGDYDGLEFMDLDLAGQDGRGRPFHGLRAAGCALDETRLRRARFIDCVLSGVRGVGTDLAEATLRDVEVVDARLGGVQLHGAVLERVLIRGGKIDYLNLRRRSSGTWSSRGGAGRAGLRRARSWSGWSSWTACCRRADFSGVRDEGRRPAAVPPSWTSRGGWTGWRAR